tara:strand:+ start:210 stop:482 length:273 start_codon:yes stop_codon:yes gene_type:complete
MLENILNNRFFTLYIIPFFIGSLAVLSFQPYNLTLINFFILPIFFYLITFIKKNQKADIEKNHLKRIFSYLVPLLDLDSFCVVCTGLQIR